MANKTVLDALGLGALPQPVTLIDPSGYTNIASNPVITADQIRALIVAGQAFVATTDQQTAAATGNFGMSIFNPSSAKNILVYSMKSVNEGGSTVFTGTFTTSNPAFGGTPNVLNANRGSNTTSVASVSYATSNASPVGTTFEVAGGSAYQTMELLTNGACILLPAGANSGVVLYNYASTTSQKWISTMKWVEY